ncbi:MAG TPA: serine--tRNA ligase [Gemmatimonadaceae bacterium]|nr:serine--tRNA ligase [Gemmatimonadaceae bacterium]
MHDIRVFRDNVDALRDAMRRRGRADLEPLISRARAVDQERRAAIQAVEERKAARNSASQEVARRKKAGEDASDLIAQTRGLGQEIARLEQELAASEGEASGLMMEFPNLLLPDVPAGGEECNVVIRSWGTPRDEAGLAPHWEIGERLGMLDLSRGAKIAGSGFPLLRNDGARLTRALMTFMLELHAREHGYEELWVPLLVNRASATATGHLPKFEDDMYAIRGEELYLIPTAEVPVTSLLRDEVLDGSRLPLRYTAYTPCFRREAGAHGKDTRGLLRLHQFDKVELVWYATPEQSPECHEILTRHAETVLQRLGLPYRVVLLAGGDTGFSSAKTYDLEVWSPGVGKWLEASSCSTFTDFQARRANVRFRPAPGEKPRFVHTLNGSGVAFARTIAALLEHYQRPDGRITVPEVLRPHLGTDTLG